MPPKRQFTGKFTKKPFTKRSYNNDDDETSSKRFKASTTASSSSAASKPPDGARHVDEEGNFYWDLGGKGRRVTVSEFMGNVMVSVREYYEKDGKSLPGKKGISMTLDQFNQLIRVLPALEEAIGQKSSNGVVRPIYTTSAKHDAPKAKSKPEIDSEDDEEEEVENKKDHNVKHEDDEEEDAKSSDIEKKPLKKPAEKSKVKEDKKPKSKKKKIPDSEDEEEEDDEDFVEEDSEEE
ncbi:hypothetical protein TWF281_000982 [Arthrobotrys megalospora]